MPVKYASGQSAGVAFTLNPTRSVVVSNESVDPTSGYEGDTVTYAATVKDNKGNALPTAFIMDLLFNTTKVVDSQALDASVYNPETGALTLAFTVPVGEGSKTVKLSWAEQKI